MRWADIDFDWKTIAMRDKYEPTRQIPLTPYVESLLRDLKVREQAQHAKLQGSPKSVGGDSEEKEPSPWVFFSDKAKSGHLEEPSHQHGRACDEANILSLIHI